MAIRMDAQIVVVSLSTKEATCSFLEASISAILVAAFHSRTVLLSLVHEAVSDLFREACMI
jgi:hypothetical protein